MSGFIKNKPFNDALEKFAFSNNLNLKITDDQFYILEPAPAQQPEKDQAQAKSQQKEKKGDDTFILESEVYSNGKIRITAVEAPIDEIIREVSEKSANSFYFSSDLQGKATLQLAGTEYQDFLDHLLTGTKYIYYKQDGIYIIGDITNTELKTFKVVQLQNRTIDQLSEFIPEDLTEGLILKEFPELNSFLITGSKVGVDRIQLFLKDIDKIVPVILIDVIIVDVKKSYIISTGIEAGIGDEPIDTRGKVFPEIDIQMGSETINDIINKFNGFGWSNLGNVTPNFYMTLRAMEDQGILNVRSTPRLSTLNGHEASISIGETEYYLEEQSNIIGTQNPQIEKVQVYKSVNAELKVTIKPFVAGDEQITLEILVEQSDFTERISKFAPPGTVTRKFESKIRVKNQDVVLLGGLEEKSSKSTARGVPLLSRIPGLKWIFSSRMREDAKSKLNIFIKPTIIG